MRRATTLALVIVTLLAGLPAPAHASEATRLDLELPDGFTFSDATVAMGALDLGAARLTDLTTVRVREIAVPDGTLYVCPVRSGQQGEIPPLPVLQDRCRDEDAYQDPRLQVGSRTWLTGRGNLTLEQPVEGTTALLWQDRNLTLNWAGTLPGEPIGLGLADDVYAFRPIRGSSEIRVEDSDDRGSYNGTQWIFYLEATGQMGLRADGAYAKVPELASVGIRKAPLSGFTAAEEPRTLLDLQDAVLGPDAREPVSNATRLFRDAGRIPHLVNGALLGHLEGSVGDNQLDPETLSLIRVESADLALEGAHLRGPAQVSFTRTAGGFADGAGDPAGIPWWLVAIAWTVALALLAWRRRRPERRPWQRWSAPALFGLGFLAWDGLFYTLVGTSAIALVRGEASLGVLLAVLGFELVALTVAWALVYLPLRIAAEQALPERFVPWGRPGAAAASLVLMALSPGTVLVMGQLLARL